MFTVLVKKFIKDYKNVKDPAVRTKYGVLSGTVGIGLNVVLFAVKYFAGLISGSVAITADAFNNLSDAGSSVITLLGFRLASTKPDKEHPFGHGRIEYLSALAVSMIIVLMGFEVGKSSVMKIISPVASEISALTISILVFSVIVKFYMYLYNRKYGKYIDSSAMAATAADSLSDAASTTVVLISMLIMKFLGADVDGWCGILVALFILKAGIDSAKDTLGDLLGRPPSKEFIDEIERIVMSHEKVIGMHDLIIHDYGPGRVMVSLHGEVPGNEDFYQMHDLIDNIEKDLQSELGCQAVIHMDPIDVDDEKLRENKEIVNRIVTDIDSRLTMHDFRMVSGPTHTNLIFDVVVPFDFSLSDSEIKSRIENAVKEQRSNFYCVINIDRPYV